MICRHPVRAGTFYEATPAECRAHAKKLIDQATLPADLTERVFGGIVPHAGWVYSGKLAAKTFNAMKGLGGPTTFVMFGAVHYSAARCGEISDRGVWRTPIGDLNVDEGLASALIAAGKGLIESNPSAHAYEHSLEVQMPFIKLLYPGALVVPIVVPPVLDSAHIGLIVGGIIAERFPQVRVIGSTDLTHHGGQQFTSPGGRGEQGMKWTAANDRRMIDLMVAMKAEKIVPEADANGNACGAGAIAATIAACRACGATRGICLEYTNSYEVVHASFPNDPDDTTVGYASVVFV